MTPKENGKTTFEVGKYLWSGSKTGYTYLARSTNGGCKYNRIEARGDNVHKMFGKLLEMKEKYRFNNMLFINKSEPTLCPPLEPLEITEMGQLEKLANSPAAIN
jgi:hypothetical protein